MKVKFRSEIKLESLWVKLTFNLRNIVPIERQSVSGEPRPSVEGFMVRGLRE